MFLPVLLMRDVGVWGWVVFAVPNCIGAALMGFVLRDPGAVERVVSHHGMAVRVFSLVTTAFQWFFAVWLVQVLGLGAWGIGGLVLFIGVLVLTPGEDRQGKRLGLAALAVFALSVGLGAAWWLTDPARVPIADLPTPRLPQGHLGPLAAVCVVGFLLCPYLDVTFLRAARRAGPSGSTAAFLVGFLVLFPVMILLTLLYAPVFVKSAVDQGVNIKLMFVPLLIAVHMLGQLGFTIAAHEKGVADEFPQGAGGGQEGWRIGAFVAGVALAWIALRQPDRGGMGFTEVVYRAFMAFYGLVFPAYVWICAWPIGEVRRPGTAKLGLAAVAVATASPFYWWGFMDQRSPMLWWGVGIVLAAGVIARFIPGSSGRGGPEGAGVPAPLDPEPDALVAHATPGREGSMDRP